MIVKLLTEHHCEFLSLTRGCRGSSEYTFVKMSNCLEVSCRQQDHTTACFIQISSSFKLFVSEQIPGDVLKDI